MKLIFPIWERLASAARLLRATLREIFDEAAYERFLARQAQPSSAGAYAAFRRETETAKARRPRCC